MINEKGIEIPLVLIFGKHNSESGAPKCVTGCVTKTENERHGRSSRET